MKENKEQAFKKRKTGNNPYEKQLNRSSLPPPPANYNPAAYTPRTSKSPQMPPPPPVDLATKWPYSEVHTGSYKHSFATHTLKKFPSVFSWLTGASHKKLTNANTLHKNLACKPESFMPVATWFRNGVCRVDEFTEETLVVLDFLKVGCLLGKIKDRIVTHVGTHNQRFLDSSDSVRHFNKSVGTLKAAVHAGLLPRLRSPNPDALMEHALLRHFPAGDDTTTAMHCVSLPTKNGSGPLATVSSVPSAIVSLYAQGYHLLFPHPDASSASDVIFRRRFHPVHDDEANDIFTNHGRSVPSVHPRVEIAIFNATPSVKVVMNEHPQPLLINSGHVFLPLQSSAESTARQKGPPPLQAVMGNTDTYALLQLGFTCYNHFHSEFLSDYVAKTMNQPSDGKK